MGLGISVRVNDDTDDAWFNSTGFSSTFLANGLFLFLTSALNNFNALGYFHNLNQVYCGVFYGSVVKMEAHSARGGFASRIPCLLANQMRIPLECYLHTHERASHQRHDEPEICSVSHQF